MRRPQQPLDRILHPAPHLVRRRIMQLRRIQTRSLHAREPPRDLGPPASQKRLYRVAQQRLPHLARADDAEALRGMHDLQTRRDGRFKDARHRFARVCDLGPGLQECDERMGRVAADEKGVVGGQEGDELGQAVRCRGRGVGVVVYAAGA